MIVKEFLKDLIGHYVIVHGEVEGTEFTVEGVLEKVNDNFIVLRVGKVRRYVMNAVIIQIIDFGGEK